MTEIIATPNMKILDEPLSDLDLPDSLIIGAIHRGNEVIIPNGDTCILEDDKVIIFSLLSELSATEKLLKDKKSRFGFLRK